MLVTSGRGTPKFIFPLDAITLLPGYGEFTCCALDHVRHGVRVDCDKVRVLSVMRTLMGAKINQLAKDNNLVDLRYYASMEQWYTRGLHGASRATDGTPNGASVPPTAPARPSVSPPSSHTPFGDDPFAQPPAAPVVISLEAVLVQDDGCVSLKDGVGVIANLKARLRWTDTDDAESIRSGWSLLRYAVLANDEAAVRALLDPTRLREMSSKQRQRYVDAPLSKPKPEYIFMKGQQTLIDAMAWAGPAIVRMLLEAGANPLCKNQLKVDPPMAAALAGRPENLDEFFKHRPDWPLNQRKSTLGLHALHYSLFVACTPFVRPTIDALMRHGADLSVVTTSGRTALHSLCMNEDCEPELLDELLPKMLGNVPVDEPQLPHGKFKVIEYVAGKLYKRGRRGNLMEHLVLINRSSALHAAVRRGDAACCELLLRRGADPAQQNVAKMTAHDVCQLCGPFEQLSTQLHASAKQRGTAPFKV